MKFRRIFAAVALSALLPSSALAVTIVSKETYVVRNTAELTHLSFDAFSSPVHSDSDPYISYAGDPVLEDSLFEWVSQPVRSRMYVIVDTYAAGTVELRFKGCTKLLTSFCEITSGWEIDGPGEKLSKDPTRLSTEFDPASEVYYREAWDSNVVLRIDSNEYRMSTDSQPEWSNELGYHSESGGWNLRLSFTKSEIVLLGTTAEVAAIPLPTPAVLLASGVGLFAALRRRRRSFR